MVQRIKGDADRRLSESIRESAHLVWLAGLGAFAKVSEEGGKLFEALVKEGEAIERRTRAVAGKTADEMRGRAAADARDQVERLFDDRLARVLDRLAIPGRDDLLELNRRLDALRARIADLRRTRDNGP